MLDALRRSVGIDWAEIDLIAATVGPGSFTGVRIGLSAARGFALAVGRPTVAVGTLEALAASWEARPDPHGGPTDVPTKVLAVLDSRRGDAYTQGFRVSPGAGVSPGFGGSEGFGLPEPLAPAVILPFDAPPPGIGGPTVVIGDVAERLADFWREGSSEAERAEGARVTAVTAPFADIHAVARIGFARWMATGSAVLTPVYLRPADAKPLAESSPAKGAEAKLGRADPVSR